MLTFLYFCNVKDISELQANGKTNAVFCRTPLCFWAAAPIFQCGRPNVLGWPLNSSFPAINTPFGTDKLPVWYGVSPCLSGALLF